MPQNHDLDGQRADAETYLIHVLTEAVPPQDPTNFEITAAARDFFEQHGTYDVRGAGAEAAEELLARHRRVVR